MQDSTLNATNDQIDDPQNGSDSADTQKPKVASIGTVVKPTV